jgi:hypothetical protein
MINHLDTIGDEINDEIDAMQKRLRSKGYEHGHVEVSFNWVGYPVWVRVGLKKGVHTDARFNGEEGNGRYSLDKALTDACRYIEELPKHVPWTNELVAATLGIEQAALAAPEAAAAE